MKRFKFLDNKSQTRRHDVVDAVFLQFKNDAPSFTRLITYPTFFIWSKPLKYKKPLLWKLLHEWKHRKYIRLISGHGFEILR